MGGIKKVTEMISSSFSGIDLVEDGVQVSLKQEVTEVRRVRAELEGMEEAVEAGLARCEVTCHDHSDTTLLSRIIEF